MRFFWSFLIFSGRGLSKNVGQHGYKRHWLKHANAVTNQRNLDQNINDSKSHIWNSFFLRISFRAYNFYIFVHTCRWTSLEFFLISDFLAESLKASRKSFCLFRVRKFALYHILTVKNSVLIALCKQMYIYFWISP